MSFFDSPDGIETLLSGSHVSFLKRDRPPLSDKERELQLENERKLQNGIIILRKLRTLALEAQDSAMRQNALKEAHQLSDQMAEVILNQALGDKPSPIDLSFLETLKETQGKYADQDDGSAHSIPPSFSISNLFQATDDMLVRIEEKAQSITKPDHRLVPEELRYVFHEFLRGANDLTINAIDKFFAQGTKIGGILSGGSVYVELVKKIVERYGDPSLTINSFVIAVDKEKKKAVFEASISDSSTRTVILTDDVTDKGGTILTAFWAAGEQFPMAIIYSGKGTDQPGGFEKRRTAEYMAHLEMIFQDFADLAGEKRDDEALAVFRQAEEYAQKYKVRLQPGWYKIKDRIEKRTKNTPQKV